MEQSTANRLAVGGAISVVLSLLTPWYVLEAHGLRGEGESGLAALGAWSFALVVLAVAVGSSLAARTRRLLPPIAAVALALLVLMKIFFPPSATSAFGSTGGDSVTQEFESALTSALTSTVGLHYAPAWGIWLAALGAATAIVGAIARLAITRNDT